MHIQLAAMAPKKKYHCRCPFNCGAAGRNQSGCSCQGGKSHECLGLKRMKEKEKKEEEEGKKEEDKKEAGRETNVWILV